MKLIDKVALDFPDSSKRTLLNWIKHGRILVEGKPCRRPHESVESYSIADRQQEIEGMKILFRDKHFIVIDKPAGLLSVPASGAAPSALSLLCRHFKTKNLFAVHRIDQDTSGVLLFVWGQEAQTKMDALFFEHRLKRQYLAIVEGQMVQESGTWSYPLKELEDYSVVVDPKGKDSLTQFELLKRCRNSSCLRLTLQTGRKHQIRVHSQEAGHPVIGDRRYGQASDRLYLHAHLLSFIHPFTGKEMLFSSPVPYAFKRRGFPCPQPSV